MTWEIYWFGNKGLTNKMSICENLHIRTHELDCRRNLSKDQKLYEIFVRWYKFRLGEDYLDKKPCCMRQQLRQYFEML